MAPKVKVRYVCSECGEDFPKWLGKCGVCGAFNSFKEFREAKEGTGNTRRQAGASAGLRPTGEVKTLAECASTPS